MGLFFNMSIWFRANLTPLQKKHFLENFICGSCIRRSFCSRWWDHKLSPARVNSGRFSRSSFMLVPSLFWEFLHTYSQSCAHLDWAAGLQCARFSQAWICYSTHLNSVPSLSDIVGLHWGSPLPSWGAGHLWGSPHSLTFSTGSIPWSACCSISQTSCSIYFGWLCRCFKEGR